MSSALEMVSWSIESYDVLSILEGMEERTILPLYPVIDIFTIKNKYGKVLVIPEQFPQFCTQVSSKHESSGTWLCLHSLQAQRTVVGGSTTKHGLHGSSCGSWMEDCTLLFWGNAFYSNAVSYWLEECTLFACCTLCKYCTLLAENSKVFH